eukprot:8799659-Prorocentrum_lima.AAC.1
MVVDDIKAFFPSLPRDAFLLSLRKFVARVKAESRHRYIVLPKFRPFCKKEAGGACGEAWVSRRQYVKPAAFLSSHNRFADAISCPIDVLPEIVDLDF